MSMWKDTAGNLYDDMDGAALSLPSWPANMMLLTDDEVAAVRAADIDPWPELAAQAKVLLLKTDDVAMRCLKAGVAYPQAWQDSVIALRAYLKAGDVTKPIPSLPTDSKGNIAYPAN